MYGSKVKPIPNEATHKLKSSMTFALLVSHSWKNTGHAVGASGTINFPYTFRIGTKIVSVDFLRHLEG